MDTYMSEEQSQRVAHVAAPAVGPVLLVQPEMHVCRRAERERRNARSEPHLRVAMELCRKEIERGGEEDSIHRRLHENNSDTHRHALFLHICRAEDFIEAVRIATLGLHDAHHPVVDEVASLDNGRRSGVERHGVTGTADILCSGQQ